ncbi:hypothetical protein RD110_07745 [Rhodoferax koreense]|uniref:TIGR02646 family protein n=1 Tax=Rhodoferax koreensis TaxID=1842727 RepID=A0A1P8JTM7_9BURK|nr:hypothetical protein [Rhodoferax koreense]APW37099.1 hypothetical protein RD110_07745 [Rhodoferax koreense]
MIRYPIGEAELRRRIEDPAQGGKAGWLALAATGQAAVAKAGRWTNGQFPELWTDVKGVYITLQHSKCAYCETVVGGAAGRVEFDVEHFRPKSRVQPWSPPAPLAALKIVVARGDAAGYHLLPYSIWNYAVSCKTCNTSYKGDRFPTAAAPAKTSAATAALKAEKAYLVYPIGSRDTDPQSLIGFNGASPCAVAKSGFPRQRALVTIAFFGLDDADRRGDIFKARAGVILAVGMCRQLLVAANAATKAKLQKRLDAFLSPAAQHSACAQAFNALWDADPALAADFMDKADALFQSSS